VSGIRPAPAWTEHGLKSTIAGQLHGVEEKKKAARISKKLLPGMSDAALYCSLAALDAVQNAALDTRDLEDQKTGCIVGSGSGGIESVYQAGVLYFSNRLRRIDPYTVLRCMSSSASSAVANVLKIRGRSYSLSSACSTSSHNIGHAYELVSSGALDRAITGGGEDLNELMAAAFQAMRLALSTRFNDTPSKASRPYDAHRDGFVLSGGGGIIVVEELEGALQRGAKIRAEIIGYGANSDAFDPVLPRPEGEQAAECMGMALLDAGLKPEDIDYVNTHGTSTVGGDAAEVQAMRRVFGEGIPPFSSTKSMTGHAVGAAGALELIFCIAMLEEGFLAPSINIETLDSTFIGLPIVTEATPAAPKTILSNNFGFGGTNVSLVIQRYDG
jgi:3-oxoacyl-[acyl-carrier-protein] synthase-1